MNHSIVARKLAFKSSKGGGKLTGAGGREGTWGMCTVLHTPSPGSDHIGRLVANKIHCSLVS